MPCTCPAAFPCSEGDRTRCLLLTQILTLLSLGLSQVRPALSQVVGVACGSGSIYALEKGGSAFAWGGGSHGELGIGAMTRAVATPSRMLWAHDVEYVTGSAGGRFGGAVDSQGRLFTFGNGEFLSHARQQWPWPVDPSAVALAG